MVLMIGNTSLCTVLLILPSTISSCRADIFSNIIVALDNAVDCASCQSALLLPMKIALDLRGDAFATTFTTICGTLLISSPLRHISLTEFILGIYSSQTAKCLWKHTITPPLVGTWASPSLVCQVHCPVISPGNIRECLLEVS